MTTRELTRERLTDCINILLDVDDATRREHQDLITRMITLLQDMRNPMPRIDTPQPDSSEQDARMRREHAAMVEFLQLVEADKSDHNTIPYGTPEWKLAYAAHLARCMLAAIDTPAAASADNGLPDGGNAEGTGYYAAPYFELDKGVSIQRNGIFYVGRDGEPVLWDSAESIEAAQTEADRLNAADTVAGSGNGGGEA